MKKLISVCLSVTISLAALLSCGSSDVMSESSTVPVNEVKYTSEDLQYLQDFLLAKPTETNLHNKSYDLDGDGKWTTFDLCLMRQNVVGSTPERTDSDTLVVYFSRTGNTEKIVEYLIKLTGADSYVIEAAIPYTDDDIKYQNDCRANREQNDKTVRPEIADPLDSIGSYDTILLGYPIWWGQEPRIIDTFLESYDFSDKTVIPFCTSASSGIATSEKNIAELVPIGSQLAGKRFPASATIDDVSEWYESLPLNKAEQNLQITVGDKVMTATLAENSSAQAFAELLKKGAVTVDMHDYGSFEKVGELPEALPRNDENITTEPGDIILYLGSNITIYYDANTWNFTRLGHIDNITQSELKTILGDGDVTIEFSLRRNST
ncbi:MAG: flavodoxin [Ruminococcus sp.]|nr:flavodoxin [Ruminococcus sp.]